MGGLVPTWTQPIIWLEFESKGAAMSLYEFLTLLFEAVKIVIDIITRLLRRRKKKKSNKK